MPDEYLSFFGSEEAAPDPTIRIKQLVSLITTNKDLYYNHPDSPDVIPDDVFDAYGYELTELDPENEILASVGADDINSPWVKAKHKIPMTSLDKIKTLEEANAWVAKRYVKFFMVEEKMDGFSISLEYEHGILQKVISRNKGIAGDDITRNAVKFKGVKKRLPTAFTGSLRAEVMFVRPEYTIYNEHAKKKGWTVFKNMRNGASGLARRFSGDGVGYLRTFYYDLQSPILSFDTRFEMMNFIKKTLGLWTPWFARVDKEALINVYTEYNNSNRTNKLYEIDGLVVKIDKFSEAATVEDALQKSDDITANPKHMVAWKFEDETRVATVTDLVGSIGLGGRVTPVVHIDPISLGGVTVTKASVHNWDLVAEHGITIGSTVLIKRANEVIPQLVRVLTKTDRGITVPTTCSKCQNDLVTEGKYLLCNNVKCPGIVAGNIRKWIKNLEINYFGMVAIEALVAEGKLETVADLYRLTVNDFVDADLGRGVAKKALGNLRGNLVVPLYLVIGSLNITGVGRSLVKKLVSAGFDTLGKFMQAQVPQMANVDGFGVERSTALWLGLRAHADTLGALKDYIVIQCPSDKVACGVLSGMTFCITGSLNQPKKVYQKMIEDSGGEYVKTFAKDLTYLIASDPNGGSSKLAKARKAGVNVISESELKKMIQG